MYSENVNAGARPVETGRGLTVSLAGQWERIGLAAVLLLTTVLDFFQLSAEGDGNLYYAAAVRSMLTNWHALLFNSFDAGGFVTIDKPPLGFWLQVLSAKLFGFNGVALMVPQALAGIASAGLVYVLVRRPWGPVAGLIAALAMAITPVAVVDNRNNIVDSTLVMVVLLGAWAVTRAADSDRAASGCRWLLLAALFVGLGFNVKMLEAYLVVPAFGAMYLLGARVAWRWRLLSLLAAAAVLLAVTFSWITFVDATPASQRPWVGSTSTNSEFDLAIGYNGLQRLTGRNAGGPFGGLGGFSAREAGPVGPLRLLDTELGGQIGWLLPLAVIGFFAAAASVWRRWPLDERQRSLLLWGMWLLTTGVFFSIAGFFHTYYLVTVAPAIAALAGTGVVALWRLYRTSRYLWGVLPLAIPAAAAVQVQLLAPYPDWAHWLDPLIIGGAGIAALALIAMRLHPVRSLPVALIAAGIGVIALLSAPAAWAADTVSNAETGTLPHAGPPATSGFGFGGGPGRAFGGPPGGFFGGGPPGGGFAGGGPGGGFDFGNGDFDRGSGRSRRFDRGRFGRRGFPGGDAADSRLIRYLIQHQGSAKYLVATTNAGTAEPIILATGKPVMAMGGFTGNDPILTVSKLAALVHNGTVRSFLLGGRGGFGGGFGSTADLTTWVETHCSAVPAARYGGSSATSGFGGPFRGDGDLYACAG